MLHRIGAANPDVIFPDFYIVLRKRIGKWLEKKGGRHEFADVLFFAPDLFHLLTRLSQDPRVPARLKVLLAATIAYFVSPVDAMPELVLGPVGWLDDILLSAIVLERLVNAGYGKLAREHWAGDEDLLGLIQRILASAERMVPPAVRRKLDAVLGSRDEGGRS